MTRRHHSWPEDLHHAFLTIKDQKFAWGSTDCLCTACSLIEAVTGVDPAKTFRGTYSNALGALKVVAAAGCSTYDELVTKMFADHGWEELPSVKFAQRGDLVMFTQADGSETFGLVHHNGKDAVCAGENSLLRLKVLSGKKAWGIGR